MLFPHMAYGLLLTFIRRTGSKTCNETELPSLAQDVSLARPAVVDSESCRTETQYQTNSGTERNLKRHQRLLHVAPCTKSLSDKTNNANVNLLVQIYGVADHRKDQSPHNNINVQMWLVNQEDSLLYWLSHGGGAKAESGKNQNDNYKQPVAGAFAVSF